MIRSIFAALLAICVVSIAPVNAGAQSVSDADAAEFRRIIASQIAAFNADDGPAAYAFAAPLIRQIFPTPDVFMSMVRKGYQPVYRQKSYAFSKVATDNAGRPNQYVTIVDMNGKTWTAVYSMERQPDGSWKISGCMLIEAPGADV
jgi:hypothetical protein